MIPVALYLTPPEFKDLEIEEIAELVAGNAFREIDGPDITTELSVGWTAPGDYMNVGPDAFTPGAIDCGGYVCLGMRLDRRRIPARTLDKHFRIEAEAWRESRRQEQMALPASGQKPHQVNKDPKPSKAQKKELKQAAKSKLLGRLIPEPLDADLIWNRAAGRLYVLASSGTVLKHFENLWSATFGRPAVALTPANRLPLLGYDWPLKAIGQEFLTWAWSTYCDPALDDDQRLQQLKNCHTRRVEDVRLSVLKEISMEQEDGESGRQRLAASGKLSEIPEIKSSIENGREIVRAVLGFTVDEEVFQVAVRSFDFMFLVKTPKVAKAARDEDEDPHGEFLERQSLLERAIGYFDDLFAYFLQGQEAEGRIERTAASAAEIAAVQQRAAEDAAKAFMDALRPTGVVSMTLRVGGKEIVIKDEPKAEDEKKTAAKAEAAA